MTKRAWMSAAALFGLALGACGDDEASHSVYFEGFVYDGASGAKLPDATTKLPEFKISVLYRDKVLDGKVDKDTGRFVVGPLPVWQDYSVSIKADGYREFLSHNPGFDVPKAVSNGTDPAVDTMNTTQTFYFDAYLFPTAVQAPGVTFTVLKAEDSTAVPQGKMRLRPRSLSSVQTGLSGTASGVSGQVWSNDLDLLATTIERPIGTAGAATPDGKVKLNAGELVYGVQYQVTIYDVPGYQPYVSSSDDYLAGSQGDKVYKVSQETLSLVMLNNDAATCVPPSVTGAVPAGAVTINFNTEVEESYENLVDAGYLDQYLTVTSTSNVLNSTAVRGCSLQVSGTQVILRWNPSLGLAQPPVTPDTITVLRYGGLQNVYVQPKGKPTQKVSLGQLVCGSTYSCSLRCGPGV